MGENPGLIGVSEAARALGVSESTIRRLADRRDLTGFRVGATRLIESASIETLLATRQKALQQAS